MRITPNPVTINSGSRTPVLLTAMFAGAGLHDAAPTGAVTFSAPTGTFSGQSCSTATDVLTCTVSYTPSGTLSPGTYNNYLSAAIAAVGDYQSGVGYSALKVTR
ncbi:MAG TPA: hypothetical protein VMR62_14735 [Bryobacteraceae bacterium]|jgi:2-keto-3-deoxy-6-phosphogluconate aldolase|nr:hypothetical protein [Bryobacteraceae bacterium]